MPFPSTIFRIFIASPSDVEKERKILRQMIIDWNAINSIEIGIYLEAVGWESHSAPEHGMRAQEIINRRVLDDCDLLVGIFWTKFGSHTGVSDSGTQEEIDRFIEQGKPVMLYFSEAAIKPKDVDNEQYTKVVAYRKKLMQNSLAYFYNNIGELKQKFSDHLSLTLRRFSKLVQPDLGIRKIHTAWVGRDIDEYVAKQEELFVMLKDGYTFFSERSDLLFERLCDPALTTKIMILHPEYEYMGAIASMDPLKRGSPELQKNDCIRAIGTMQRMREKIQQKTGRDISKQVTFVGYRLVPTWNGFVGRTRATIHLYPTIPYRGDLQTLEITAQYRSCEETDWYRRYRDEFIQIERQSTSKYVDADLWEYRPNAIGPKV
jgi:nucleoside 2-deoxyribosyltransferase